MATPAYAFTFANNSDIPSESNRIEVNKNKGIIKCFLRVVDEESKLDLESLVDTMASLIEKKKAFSECSAWIHETRSIKVQGDHRAQNLGV
eukprot:967900_1